MMNNKIVKVYYWAHNNNFGDLLTPLMLKHYTNAIPVWAEPATAQVLLTGSNLDVLPRKGWTGIVAGAGMLHRSTEIDLSNAKILGMRGRLTQERVWRHIDEKFVLGDPGLLASELVLPERGKYEIGVVPHWTDNKLWDRELAASKRWGYATPTLISPTDPPLEVLRKIGSCNKIVTSSLHAVIVADSFSLPRRVERFEQMDTNPYEGDDFKFQDYASALGETITFGKMEWAQKEVVDTVKAGLFEMMKELKCLINP